MPSEKKKIPAIGTRYEVWHGKAKHTSGGLKKGNLMLNKRGSIVSVLRHQNGMKAYAKNKEKMMKGHSEFKRVLSKACDNKLRKQKKKSKKK